MDAVVTSLPMSKGLESPRRRRPSREEAEAAVRTLIEWVGDNPDREGLIDTPRRMVKAWEDLFRGYGDVVLVRDIPFFSHCEHHIVPIMGRAHIAYYPREGVVGLSKLAKVVDIYARRLQTQENMTAEIVGAIEESLKPRGLAVLVEAEHMCMSMRGVQKQGVSTITTGFTGLFKDDASEQARFMQMIRGFR